MGRGSYAIVFLVSPYIITYVCQIYQSEWALFYCSSVAFAEAEGPTAESSDTVGPSASATVDKFEAVPGHSFLAILRCPQRATIARKWKVAINPPPHGKWRSAEPARGCYIYTHVRPLSTMSRQYAHYCVVILHFEWLFIIYNITWFRRIFWELLVNIWE